jgi:DNA-binding response OmpR family regulator
MRVLLVDDDSEILTELGDALRKLGYEVATADSGKVALEVAAKFRPDAALVDVGLPDINGITLSNLLRGVVGDKPLRIIGLSGWSRETLRAAVNKRLFDDCVFKPASVREIQRSLWPHAAG